MNNHIRSELYRLDRSSGTPVISSTRVPSPSPCPIKKKVFRIPHMDKHMGPVEKYVNNFKNITLSISRSNKHQGAKIESVSLSKLDLYQDSFYKNASKVCGNSVLLGHNDIKRSEKNIFQELIYSSANSKDTIGRVSSLDRLQQSYVGFKDNVKITHRLPIIKHSKFKQLLNRRDKSKTTVTQQQVQSRLKTSVVQEQGKKYFADLYILRKGRDKVMQSLQNIGKDEELSSTLQSYNNIVNDVKHYNSEKYRSEQLTKMMIMQERQLKKKKMITNKNLHWNVYYNLLALPKHEKSKVREKSRFGTHYGVD